MPNYNHGHLIEVAITSIMSQNPTPFEIIIIDDASTDNSKEVINNLSRKVGNIKTIFLSANVGPIAAARLAFDDVEGDLIHFAAADDEIEAGAYGILTSALENYPEAAFASGLVKVIDRKGASLKPLLVPSSQLIYFKPSVVKKKLKYSDNFILTMTCLFRVEHIKKLGFFDPNLESMSDGIFARKLALKFGFVFIPEILYSWNRDENGLSQKANKDVSKFFIILEKIAVEMEKDDIYPRWYLRKFLARLHFSNIVVLIKNANLIDEYLSYLNLYADIGRLRFMLLKFILKARLMPKQIKKLFSYLLLLPAHPLSIIASFFVRKKLIRVSNMDKNGVRGKLAL